MRRPVAGPFALAAALAAACLAQQALAGGDGETPARTAPAAPHVEKTFLIPSSDGYGVGECLTTPGSECGQTVANAWCEAQGYAAAGSYGVAAADEYTGAIDRPAVTKPADRPIRITCQD
ncbi:hypothetical protein Q8W71_08205 [Methylobacterium sp. NEAU 140]|uniref:hypothetical protein n=1 Tax=Methylobacterium sp. NEAU 140 TaxID=3064945 RepID=UPI002735B7CA|nr:hypothetical protein [Methylobacterium sp. NEAU 140]MDP4022600.1 hypothetical protein [Methylobacterium sp. NEAU 140]